VQPVRAVWRCSAHRITKGRLVGAEVVRDREWAARVKDEYGIGLPSAVAIFLNPLVPLPNGSSYVV